MADAASGVETSQSGWKVADKAWERMQQRAFTRWVNMHLAKRGQNVEDVETDFCDGIMLTSLLEIISGDPMPTKVMKKARMRIQYLQNLSIAIDFITNRGIRLENISAEDVADGNKKLILGLIWTLIEKFEIDDISEEELSAKDALLLWCQKKTKPYDKINLKNFTTDWKDGLAFVGIIHRHRPNLIANPDSLSRSEAAENLELAFSVAENDLGIPRFLDVQDIVDAVKPDERSIVTYVLQFYKLFSADQKGETAARRIGNLIAMTQTMDQMKGDYAGRAPTLVEWITHKTDELDNMESDNTLEGVRSLINDFNTYRNDEKPPKAAEKLELEGLETAIQIKLRQANRPPWTPPADCSSAEIQELWDQLNESERQRWEALQAELARQEKIRNLLNRFNRKAAKLEAWHETKSAYANRVENIDSLNAAETRMRIFEAYKGEYEESKGRLAVVRDLGQQIIDLDYVEKDAVAARVAALDGSWEALDTANGEKEARLNEALAREQRKDELRRDFAEKATELNRHYKDKAIDLSVHDFGDDLESVRAHEEVLTADDEAVRTEAGGKKEALDAVNADLTELGVTDNKYTVLTMDDIERGAAGLEDNIGGRRTAYDAEVARQEMLEAKRVEFAAAMDAAMAFVEGVNEEISGYTGDDPEPLAEQISAKYEDGAACQAKVDEMKAMDVECKKLGITSNSHLNHTVPQLRSRKKTLDIKVKNYLYGLAQEARLKKQYASRAAELMAWIEENNAILADHSNLGDNTLEAARAAVEWLNNWRVTDKATKSALKSEVAVIHTNVNNVLETSDHNRPPFAAEPSLDAIEAAWDGLTTTEKDRDDVVQAELSRQEQLAQLTRHLAVEREDLEAWIERKEAYLARDTAIDSLTAAQVQITTYEAFVEEYSNYQVRRDKMMETLGQIRELNYGDIDALDAQVAAVNDRFNALEATGTAKKEGLDTALADQEVKVSAREAYNLASSDFVRWCRDACDQIEAYNFGSTLDEVTAYAADLDANDAEVNGEAGTRETAAADAWGQIAELGIDGESFVVSMEDVAGEKAVVEETLAKRRAAYDDEMARQNAMEEVRVSFAGAADAFVAWLDESLAGIKAVPKDDEDAATAAIGELWGEGSVAAGELDKVREVDQQALEMGVTSNPHTELSMPKLEAKVATYNATVSNELGDLAESKVLKERSAAQEAERADKEAAENLSIAYSQERQKLMLWLDQVDEAVSEDLTELDSVELVTDQRNLWTEASAGKDEGAALMARLVELGAEMEQKGVDFDGKSPAEVQAFYDETVASLDARDGELNDANELQTRNAALQAAFGEPAQVLSAWMEQTRQDAANVTEAGELEDQLEAAKAVVGSMESEGAPKLAALDEPAAALTEAGIASGSELTYDSLKLEYEKLSGVVSSKLHLIEGEIARQKNSDVSPEQLKEFRDSFAHFDRNNTGTLNKLEFKSCLQSLGEDPTDEEVDRIMAELDHDGSGEIDMAEFISFMSSHSRDNDTEEELVAAFATAAGDADFVTEAQLSTILSAEEVAYLVSEMPPYEGVEGGYDYKAWTAAAFGR